MRRVLILLLVLLPSLGWAGSIDTTAYQVNVSGTWLSTNPSCVSNCTETMSMSFVYDAYPGLVNDVYGVIPLSTFQMASSGFLGSFIPPSSTSGLMQVDDFADGIAFRSSLGDEIDLDHFGFLGPNPIRLFIYDCFSAECSDAYPHHIPSPAYIDANALTTTVVQVPDEPSGWVLLLISAVACGFGLRVNHRSAYSQETVRLESSTVSLTT